MRPDPVLGVFDTLLVQHGEPVHLAAHMHRLEASVLELYGERIDVSALVRSAAAGIDLARLRTTYVPGGGIDLTLTPLAERPTTPWRLVPVVVPGGWGEHKWVDRRALESARWDAATDALLLDTDGSVLETARGNVFAVLDGVVVTPPLDGRILPGVIRSLIPHEERPLRLSDLALAEQVFVTNSIGGRRPVARIETVPTG